MNVVSQSVNIGSETAIPYLPAGDPTFYLSFDAQDHRQTLEISVRNNEQDRKQAADLINRRYGWRGYGTNHTLVGRPQETTFYANLDGALIGTLTLTADSPWGLSLDDTFSEEIQLFRHRPNTQLCELTKLAIENKSTSKALLAALFRFVFNYGTERRLGTDLLIEINPRHELFYYKMLGFTPVGERKINRSVNAPSQLMWIPVRSIKEAIISDDPHLYKNTLYRYL